MFKYSLKYKYDVAFKGLVLKKRMFSVLCFVLMPHFVTQTCKYSPHLDAWGSHRMSQPKKDAASPIGVSQRGQPVQLGAEDDRQEVEEERNKTKAATSLWGNFPVQYRSAEVAERESVSGWGRASRMEVVVGHNSPRRDWGGQPLKITSERQRKGAATFLRFLRYSREPNHRHVVFFVVTHSHIHC